MEGETDPPEETPAATSERERALREQYENAWKQLQDVRNNVERLRKEHIRLTDEASNIRLETYEYMNYMEKKTSKRQSMIVSLNDQNQKEIEKIKEEERQLTEEFERQKEELREKNSHQRKSAGVNAARAQQSRRISRIAAKTIGKNQRATRSSRQDASGALGNDSATQGPVLGREESV